MLKIKLRIMNNERKCVLALAIDACVNQVLDEFFRPFDKGLYNLKPSVMFSTIVFACYVKLRALNPYGFEAASAYSIYYRDRYAYVVVVHPYLFDDVSLFLDNHKPSL